MRFALARAQALERPVGAETAARQRASRIVLDAEAWHRRLVDAGVREVTVHPREMTSRWPRIDACVLGHLAGTPVAGAVAAVSEEARGALAREGRLA
jgi:hypothetical protein